MLLMIYMAWQKFLTALPFVVGSYFIIWNILRIRFRDKLIPAHTTTYQLPDVYLKIFVTASMGIATGIGFIVIGILTLLGG